MSLVASAMKITMDGVGNNNWRFRDQTWQREMWRLYDIIPEFRAAAGWVGSCCSRVRIYVAEVDKLGRIQGEATDPKISALADSVFGSPAAKAEALRIGGINLTVAGEYYILGQAAPDDSEDDKWYVLSSMEVRRVKGGDVYWGDQMGQRILDSAREMITRVWTPHPSRIMWADCPAKACQPVLRELEQLTKYTFSQIDSRLAGAGLFIIPNDIDFPADDNTSTASESLMMRLAEAMSASLKGEGQATALVPLILEAPTDSIDRGFKYITFATELSKQAMELKQEAIKRLGMGMDMPPEVLSGMGDTNHWSAVQIDEQGTKVHIDPLMTRQCSALTDAYLRPALKIMGKDPRRYVYWFDTAPLTARPQRLTDALNLYEKGILSEAAVRAEGDFAEADAPDADERAVRFVREVILRDPQLFSMQGPRELAGITEEMLPQSAIAPTAVGQGEGGLPGPSGPPPPPPPPTGIQNTLPGPVPNEGQVPTVPPGTPPPPGSNPPPGLTASALTEREQMRNMALVVAAEATVRRCLELAGGRLLDRHNRDRWPDVPRHELHTRIKVTDGAHATRLMNGGWEHLGELSALLDASIDVDVFREALNQYCSILLTKSVAHEARLLVTMLRSKGLLYG